MKNQFMKVTIILLVFIFILAGCSGNKEPETSAPKSEEVILTLKELSQFNGMDGKPSYVAIDRVIYDVTDATPWKGGMHNGFSAGKDLTKEIKTISPHGISKLKEVPIVGKLKD
ncbi:cytochrome b5 domain-containing protein [Tissierella creatinophila]|uniref:Cytochrome b5-like heme/steroid binding domain protein n=1 Tax=Tissierella creatinophila DSM 6911 TaxID=1123403 RepID=A0A1U7M9E8_TISCR|nr:cytochrome b5 domain-containing protein [Tissierella creatinophila]OLS03828.1 cytochrome b5-like heme/steroid binding domain protein [Tissierella creatinophila DSM 6911]